jgi:hypothetical protein
MSNMTPTLRRALHQALDLVLDALAEEPEKPRRKRRPCVVRTLPLPADTTPADMACVEAQLARAGFRKAG